MGKKRKKIFFNEEEKEIKIENKEEKEDTKPVVKEQLKKIQIKQSKRVFEDSVKVM